MNKIDFVDLMDGRSICFYENEEQMSDFWYSDKWILEPTYHSRRIQFLINDNITFWGKKKKYQAPNLQNKINHIITELASLRLKPGTLLDGNLTFENVSENDSGLLTSFFQYNDVSMAENLQQQYTRIKFYITDIIYNENKSCNDLSLFDRKRILNKLIKQDLQYIKIQPIINKKKYEYFKENKKNIKIFIFKDIDSMYDFRTSSSWKIFKEPTTYYMKISGFIDGKNETHKNMVVALEGSQYKNNVMSKIMNIPVNSSSDMEYFFKHKNELFGKIFEIKAFEKLNQKYQEARFHRIRNDLVDDKICIFTEGEEE
jgi:hypothetical protein